MVLLPDSLLMELRVLGKELSVLGARDSIDADVKRLYTDEDDVAVISLRSREERVAAMVF